MHIGLPLLGAGAGYAAFILSNPLAWQAFGWGILGAGIGLPLS